MPKTEKASRVRIEFAGVAVDLDRNEDPLVAAANPRPAWTLNISDPAGQIGSYGLWHPMDLMSSDTIKVMSIERDTREADGAAYMQRIREQIQQIVPELPDAVFERLTSRQLLAIGMKAWQVPGETKPEKTDREADLENPREGERASASSSRSPVASMDGATRN